LFDGLDAIENRAEIELRDLKVIIVLQIEPKLCQPGGSPTLGYSAGRKATIDVTDLIWKRATIKSFALLAQPPAAREEAWKTIVRLLQSGGIKPIVAKTFPLAEASDALRYLTEERPFGKIVLTI
jgi:NADPH2:quinone reductase